jgi:CDP-diacylglycerol---glycerol-3-phosphate 3-phosphatidyltransferase
MNLATVLTTSRIVIAPVFAMVFVHGYRSDSTSVSWIYICFGLAVLIELSDMFDGMAARARKQVTDFGKVYDPIADSVSRQTVFISFMYTNIIPLWMYMVFFYRDAFMQLLRIVCASGGYVLAARMSGKIKAVLQGIAAFCMLAVILVQRMEAPWMPAPKPEWLWDLWGHDPGYWVMLVVAIYTLISVVDYVIPNRALIVKMMKNKNGS